MKLLLIQNARLYTKKTKTQDILIINDEIVEVAENIDTKQLTALGLGEPTVINAENNIVIPGLIDGHAHVLGAAGEAGYETRAHEIPLKALLSAGITTVIGLLGVDSLTRSPKALCAKIRALENEGITARMLTGSYHFPPRTITETCKSDVYLFPDIIGVGEIAISDKRSSQPTVQEIQRLIKETLLGAHAKGQKASIVFHCGNEKAGAAIIEEVLERTDIPAESIIVTHINRNTTLLNQAKRLVKKGCFVDLSSLYFKDTKRFISPEEGLRQLVKAKIPLSQILISSDAGCYIEDATLTQPAWLYQAFVTIVQKKILSLADAVKLFSTNPATAYGLTKKGSLEKGKDADLLILADNYSLHSVIAKGRVMIHKGIIVHKDFTNGQDYKTL